MSDNGKALREMREAYNEAMELINYEQYCTIY